ncbi:uncharacterized protein LOC131330261 [Rhododendron vialii]|uniref:uncharacterized protein LOC131330261 n=1 Tax=Rhododendron vialii TaxID=182163 RepID=UPI00265DEC23|nr:uncharacterized protein LOC131330261 [Rhododendron vialii]
MDSSPVELGFLLQVLLPPKGLFFYLFQNLYIRTPFIQFIQLPLSCSEKNQKLFCDLLHQLKRRIILWGSPHQVHNQATMKKHQLHPLFVPWFLIAEIETTW